MTRTRSLMILAASVVGFGLFGSAMGFLLFYGAEDTALRLRSMAAMSVIGAPMGLLYWGMSVEPVKVPLPAKGWRRWRPLFWLVGLTFAYTVIVLGFGRSLGDAFSGALFFAVFVTLFGWAVGATRADRARGIQSRKVRMDAANRLKGVLMEMVKSDPYQQDFDDLKTFLAEPFTVLASLARGNTMSSQLAYGRGVLAAVIVPESFNDKPIAAEYALVLTAAKTLLIEEDIEPSESLEQVLTYLEDRAETFRKARLAKKL